MDKNRKIVFRIVMGIVFIILIVPVIIIVWTKSPSINLEKVYEEAQQKKQIETQNQKIYTLYILDNSYKIIPGEFNPDLERDEFVEIQNIKDDLLQNLETEKECIIFFKAMPGSSIQMLTGLLDVLSEQKIKYGFKEISETEVMFLNEE